MKPAAWIAAAAMLLTLALGGCGYQWADTGGGGFAQEPGHKWNGLYRQDVKTVAVPIFTNRTYYRGVEFNLTKAVINQIESRTPYKVVPKERADTVLEGEVINVGLFTQSRSQTMGLPQEQLYHIIVNFTWKDLRTGQMLTVRHGFEQTSPYYPTLGEDQFAGSQDAIERLGLAIAEELQANWGDVKNAQTTQPSK
jgi:hypothetical protein